MYNAPYGYDFINEYNGNIDPSTVHCNNSTLTWYFKRYLTQKAFSVFKWTLPEHWNPDYFKYVLYYMGYIAVVNTDKFGTIPQIAGLRGYNVFYAPTHAIITNPLISGILEPVIDEQCVVIKLTPDYMGITDLISYYADLMALTSEMFGMNVSNSKLSYIAGAKSKTMAEALKKMYDAIQGGNPFVVYDSKYQSDVDKNMIEFYSQNLKENFIAPDAMLVLKKLENEFASKIGLNNVNTEKKERLTNEEVNANNDETYAVASDWLDSLKNGCSKVNDMFNLNLSVEWRFKHNERNNVNFGTV